MSACCFVITIYYRYIKRGIPVYTIYLYIYYIINIYVFTTSYMLYTSAACLVSIYRKSNRKKNVYNRIDYWAHVRDGFRAGRPLIFGRNPIRSSPARYNIIIIIITIIHVYLYLGIYVNV